MKLFALLLMITTAGVAIWTIIEQGDLSTALPPGIGFLVSLILFLYAWRR